MNIYTIFGSCIVVCVFIPIIYMIASIKYNDVVVVPSDSTSKSSNNILSNLTLYNQSTYFYDHPNCTLSNNNFYFNNLSFDDYLKVYPILRFDWLCSKKALVVYTLSFNYTWVSVVV